MSGLSVCCRVMAPKLRRVEGTPTITVPYFLVVKINRQWLQILIEESYCTAMWQKLKHRRRPDRILSSQLVKQRHATTQSFGYRIAINQGGKRISRTFIGHSNHHDLINICGTGPGWTNRLITGRKICIAVHRCITSDQPTHRMGHDIETQIGSFQGFLQALNLSYQLARICHIVEAPVVREDVESVMVAVYSRIVPIRFAIPRVIP